MTFRTMTLIRIAFFTTALFNILSNMFYTVVLSVVVLHVIKLSVILLSVVIHNVVAPSLKSKALSIAGLTQVAFVADK